MDEEQRKNAVLVVVRRLKESTGRRLLMSLLSEPDTTKIQRILEDLERDKLIEIKRGDGRLAEWHIKAVHNGNSESH